MFLTRVFIGARYPLDGHRANNKRLTTIMKTFLALGLKPQAPKKRRTRRRKILLSKRPIQKEKSKPSREDKKKKGGERSLSPILKEKRTSKRRIMKLVEDEVSTIGIEPFNLAESVVQATTRAAKPA